jgi:hypothetical protein
VEHPIMKRRQFIVAAGSTLLLAACGKDALAKGTIEVYKESTCGCCRVWVGYMEDHGYAVNAHDVLDIARRKREYGVPASVESCHTARVGGYTVEGHIPAKVVDKLLAERPAIDGIALPGMPEGSPGMPGEKREPWTVYAIKDGTYSVYVTL